MESTVQRCVTGARQRRAIAFVVMVGIVSVGLPGAPLSLLRTPAALAGPSNASIGDLVFNDANGNGIKDTSEIGMGSVTVSLRGAGRDGVLDTSDDTTFTPKVTTSAGAYSYTSLAAGRYRVTVTPPTGYSATTTNPLVVTIAAGQVYTLADFGVRQANASIGDLVFNDANGNGTKDTGETGKSGVALTLKEGSVTRATTTSDAAGAFSFGSLPAGTYTVEAATPSGWTARTPVSFTVTLTAGQVHTAADFGFQQSNASIGDLVYEDDNGNGVLDAGEVGLAGVVVTLSQGTTQLATATTDTTDTAGLYGFGSLVAGSYTVTVTTPVNFSRTTTSPLVVSLAAGQAYTAADFGVREATATIGDFVFEDANRNGLYDVGEQGLGGISVTLKSGTTDVATTVTAANGTYSFTGLPAGSYTVVPNVKGYSPTTAIPLAVTVASGESFVGADVGLVYLPEITVNLNPAGVSTFAGSGANSDTDGVGAAAAFGGSMGGVAVVGGFAFVSTTRYMRKVDLATGAVTKLAGSETAAACTDSNDPTAVGFVTWSSGSSSLAADGYYVYSMCGNKLRRTSVTTGATSTLATNLNSTIGFGVGPDGYIYVNTDTGIRRVDPVTGVYTVFGSRPGSNGSVLAVDATAVWAAAVANNTENLYRVPLSGGAPTVVGIIPSGLTAMTSAGAYLYATRGSNNSIVRISKVDGTWTSVAGTGMTGAFADGTEFDALFSSPQGIASDGGSLLIADYGNYRLRRAVPGSLRPRAASPADVTVNLNPAEVSTVAGSGANADTDGLGAAAAFGDSMGGAAVAGGYAYVATARYMRKVDLATGAVTKLAGSPTASACTDSGDPNAVGFVTWSSGSSSIATDGQYVYSMCGNKLRRTSATTGATSTLATNLNFIVGMALGPDGYIYLNGDLDVYRVDPMTGAWGPFNDRPGGGGSVIASDATAVWAAAVANNTQNLYRVPIAGGTPTVAGVMPSGLTAMTSAGAYLYATRGYNNSIVRISKADGTWTSVAGTGMTGAFADGTEFDALLNAPQGIASDGGSLVIADLGNFRLRRAGAGQPRPRAASPADATVNLNPAQVLTYAGSGANADTDGVGTAAAFSGMNATAVAGGFAYVATTRYIRKVDLATGAVTTLAGSGTAVACTDSGDPAAVGFVTWSASSSLAADGHYVYSMCGNKLRRTSVTTGATSTLATQLNNVGGFTLGSDGYLYVNRS